MPSGLQITDLHFAYPRGEASVRVRSFEMAPGETVALVGPSGAGKTTLLRLIAGILEPASGGISFAGEDLRAIKPQARRRMRLARVGVVFQDFALMDYLTVAENLLLPLRLGSGVTPAHEARARAFADRLEVGRYWQKPTKELSQGEQQRVAIARALVHEPELVLADEPTASLDGSRKMTAARFMLDDARGRNAALLMVTHDPELLPLFDRVVNLEDLGVVNLAGPFHLAWRYVARHRAQSLLLAGALGVVLALPLAVRLLVHTAERQLRARAESTPAGPRGSETDLMLSALHFRQGAAEPLHVRACDELRDTGLAEAIPLHLRFHAESAPVGTELEYFDFRHLKVTEGRMITRLGDCVVGARVAQKRALHPGGAVYSSPEQVFNIAGVYPLKMRVTGVLAASGTPDDEAIFVDIKTAWLIQGLGHGHDDLVKPENAGAVLSKKDGEVVANASVRMFNEVTDANVASFHFHGDEADFPIHAMIVLPHDTQSEAILAGRYQGNKEVQVIRPTDVLEVLLGALFRIEGLVVAALALVAGAAAAVAALVFGLSFRMRQREFATLAEVGVGRGTLRLAKTCEVAIVGFGALGITFGLIALLRFLADTAIIDRLK